MAMFSFFFFTLHEELARGAIKNEQRQSAVFEHRYEMYSKNVNVHRMLLRCRCFK